MVFKLLQLSIQEIPPGISIFLLYWGKLHHEAFPDLLFQSLFFLQRRDEVRVVEDVSGRIGQFTQQHVLEALQH